MLSLTYLPQCLKWMLHILQWKLHILHWAFLTFSQLCLVYPVLKILENWKKKHNFLRVKITSQYYFKGITLGGTPTLVFSEMGHGKTKSNRWVERSPKMRNLSRYHCLQKFTKYEKTTKTHRNLAALSNQTCRIRWRF